MMIPNNSGNVYELNPDTGGNLYLKTDDNTKLVLLTLPYPGIVRNDRHFNCITCLHTDKRVMDPVFYQYKYFELQKDEWEHLGNVRFREGEHAVSFTNKLLYADVILIFNDHIEYKNSVSKRILELMKNT